MSPRVDPGAFVHERAVVIGNVDIASGCSVWPQAVIRGDENSIVIGEGSNVQDCAVIHVNAKFAARLGRNVSLGHGCVVHGATIEDDVIIGMNAVVLNGAVVGAGSVVGANALVKEGSKVAPGSLVVGIPARAIREGDAKLRETAVANADTYRRLALEHAAGKFPAYKGGR